MKRSRLGNRQFETKSIYWKEQYREITEANNTEFDTETYGNEIFSVATEDLGFRVYVQPIYIRVSGETKEVACL